MGLFNKAEGITAKAFGTAREKGGIFFIRLLHASHPFPIRGQRVFGKLRVRINLEGGVLSFHQRQGKPHRHFLGGTT